VASQDPPGERLRALLAARGVPGDPPIHHFPTLSSTNDHAKVLARGGAPAGTLVLAEEQTAGRGREGHTWSSPPGGLYLSVLLRPSPASDARWSLLPLAAGLAVAEALDEWGAQAQLKWPNDLLEEGRKLGGILVEAASGASGIESMVVGIGVNVRKPADADVFRMAWLEREPAAHGVDPMAVAASVLARLTVWYHALAREGGVEMLSAWRRRAVPWWGRRVEARAGDSVISGTLRGLADDGGLILELPDGRETVLHSGEVREVRARTG
jgi:BirA family transcriptional regulator, biotin operon repressor / biotin---[acetyl-CoA-carboxylase] ligase